MAMVIVVVRQRAGFWRVHLGEDVLPVPSYGEYGARNSLRMPAVLLVWVRCKVAFV
jgi:hypothetical protein